MNDNLISRKAKTKKYFNETADKCEGRYNPVESLPDKIQTWVKRRTLELIRNSDSLLDCGCGNGDFIIEYTKKHCLYRKIVGVDFSDKMIDVAQKHSKGLPNIFFKIRELKTLNFQMMEFETVICLDVLHHIHSEELEEVLNNMARVSAKHVILEYKNNISPYHIIKKIKARFGRMSLKINGTNLWKLKKILVQKGFIIDKKVSLFSLGCIVSPIIIVRFVRNRP